MSLQFQNLVGKHFELGVQDCFQLVIDFFEQNFGITIPNIARPTNWKADDIDLIGQFYHLSGFKKLDVEENWPPRPADVLVTIVGGSAPNHLVIYLGGNEIIHHKQYSISSVETLRPVWKKATSFILRHPDVPDLTPVKPTLILKDLLNERFV